MGLEPTQIALHVPETCAYTNCATAANNTYYIKRQDINPAFISAEKGT